MEEEINNLYNKIKEKDLMIHLGFIEPLEHIITVDNIRRYWKPDKVRIILLAESHIKTDQNVFEHEKDLTIFDGVDSNYPRNVVNFVYCLGQDAGKIQFWKILSASVGKFDFSKLKLNNFSFEERTRHRIEIIREMQKRGIWLVDASIFALYPKNKKSNTVKVRKEIINECWASYIKDVVLGESPKRIIFIGKEVWKTLADKIPSSIDTKWIYQPQAHIKGGYQSQLLKCYNFCNLE